MTLSVETVIVVGLMLAVFAAVSTIGGTLYLGAAHERLRAGFETVKKQTAFFSDAILKLDYRVEAVEKQSGYFFEAITGLEQQQAVSTHEAQSERWQPNFGAATEKRIMASKDDASHAGTENLLTCAGFITQPVGRESLSEQFCNKAMREIENRPSFH